MPTLMCALGLYPASCTLGAKPSFDVRSFVLPVVNVTSPNENEPEPSVIADKPAGTPAISSTVAPTTGLPTLSLTQPSIVSVTVCATAGTGVGELGVGPLHAPKRPRQARAMDVAAFRRNLPEHHDRSVSSPLQVQWGNPDQTSVSSCLRSS